MTTADQLRAAKAEIEFRREIRPSLRAGRLRINWYLHGPEATIQFVLRVAKDKPDPRWPSLPRFEAQGWDIGIHYRKEPDHTSCAGHFTDCDVLDGGECWYEGTGLGADELLTRLLTADDPNEDAEEIWTELEAWYADRFGEMAEGEGS